VYADSLSPISADGFKFTNSSVDPHAIQDFQKSFQFLDTTPCDILLTPHAEASQFWERMEGHDKGVKPDPLIDPSLCRQLADSSRKALEERIHIEEGH
jgi:metallo-beta-lactamase class B